MNVKFKVILSVWLVLIIFMLAFYATAPQLPTDLSLPLGKSALDIHIPWYVIAVMVMFATPTVIGVVDYLVFNGNDYSGLLFVLVVWVVVSVVFAIILKVIVISLPLVPAPDSYMLYLPHLLTITPILGALIILFACYRVVGEIEAEFIFFGAVLIFFTNFLYVLMLHPALPEGVILIKYLPFICFFTVFVFASIVGVAILCILLGSYREERKIIKKLA